MKGLVAAAAVALLMPAAFACDHGDQDCAKLQIADCSGESRCPEAQGGLLRAWTHPRRRQRTLKHTRKARRQSGGPICIGSVRRDQHAGV
jgi:hypothetical protein